MDQNVVIKTKLLIVNCCVVQPGREQLCDDGRLESVLHEAEGGAEAGAAGTDNHCVIGVIDHGVFACRSSIG